MQKNRQEKLQKYQKLKRDWSKQQSPVIHRLVRAFYVIKNTIDLIKEIKTGYYLAAGNELSAGMDQERADKICRQNSDTVMGYCYAINNPNCCYIKYKNTALGQSSDWNSVIFT